MQKDSLELIEEIVNNIKFSKELQYQASKVYIQPVIDAINNMHQSFPSIESVRLYQLEMQHLGQKISEAIRIQQQAFDSIKIPLEQWTSSLNTLSQIRFPQNTVPDSVYEHLMELSETVKNNRPSERYSEIDISLTVRRPNNQKTEKLTWHQLLALIVAILGLFQNQFNDYQNNIQSDNYHNEQMVELKKQTALQEEEIRIQRLQLDQLNEAIHSFLKFIDPLIAEDLIDSEDK